MAQRKQVLLKRTSPRGPAGHDAGPLAAPDSAVTPEQRRLMIEEAAYYRAAQAGFCGDPVDYWLAAEREVDFRLNGNQGPVSLVP